MICLSFHGLLFVGRANLENSIPQKTVSVIAEGAILLVKYAVNRGQQKGGRGLIEVARGTRGGHTLKIVR